MKGEFKWKCGKGADGDLVESFFSLKSASEEFAQAQELPLYSLWFSYVCCVRIAACYSSDTRMDSNSTYTYITNCPHINTHTHTHTHTHTQTNKYRGNHARNLTDKYPYTHGCAPSCMHMFG